jgi:arylsulfatase A-like enzyme
MKFLKICCLLLLPLLCIQCESKESKEEAIAENTKPPNILIIYPDQLRRYSAGFWSEDKYKGHVIGKPDPVITPNIDRLAKNGVVFTQAISNFPLCSPARGMLLSGMYPEQNGIWNNCRQDREDSLKDEVNTITDLFFDAGYNTAYFGKCHWLKNDPHFDEKGNYIGKTDAPGGHYLNRYDTYIPPGKARHSIEYFYQAIKDVHYDPLVFSNDPNAIEGKKDGELHQPKIFSPKNEAQKIISYLQNQNSERDQNKPFCMIWSLNPPHNPWDDKNTDMEMLKKHYDVDKYPEIDTSLVVRENADLEVANYARHYFANVTSVDMYIGKVLDALQNMGELNNTIVIFTSDHGELMGSHGLTGKNIAEMESLAVPFIVHWPNSIKGGAINDILLSVPDVLPTIMGLAGIQSSIPAEVEGMNFSTALTQADKEKMLSPEGSLILLGNARGVYTKRYTLCISESKVNKTGSKEAAYIYDREKDPYELHRIPLSEQPETAAKLLKILAEKLEYTNDPWFQNRKFSNIIPYNEI